MEKRKRFFKLKCILLIFTQCAVLFALTGGPVQQEFTSFEQVENASLVSLPTGNMVYTIPFGEVKGPSGIGYPVQLAYHAGIKNDQEASWTGLGWDLNAGAINRMVRGFPDDYNSEPFLIHTRALAGGKDEFFSTAGGYYLVTGFTFHRANWGDDQKFSFWGGMVGFSYGGTSGFSFDKHGNTSFFNSCAGTNWGYTKNEGDKKAEWYAQGSIDILMAAGIKPPAPGPTLVNVTLSTNDNAKWEFAGFSKISSGSSEGGWAFSTRGFAFNGGLLGIPFSYAQYNTNAVFDEITQGSAVGYLYQSPYAPSKVITRDKLLAAAMNGEENSSWKYLLNADDGSTVSVKKKRSLDRLEYAEMDTFSMAAQDIYMVLGQGITGSFKPIANKSMASCFSENVDYNGLIGKPKANPASWEDPFEYYFNNEHNLVSPKYSDGITFKMIGEAALNLVDNCSEVYPGSTDYSNIVTEGGLASKTWGTQIEPIFGQDPQFKDKLTGFIVTTQDGMKYFYTQPLFSLQNITLANNAKVIPKDLSRCGQSDCYGDEQCRCSYKQDYGAYATSWLLTAITGPDYIKKTWLNKNSEDYYEGDNNIAIENLMPHQGDYGYWVLFKYEYGPPVRAGGNKIPEVNNVEGAYKKATYPWQVPYKNWTESKCEPGFYFTSFGLKEITYLKSIETASEVAFFRTSERLDGQGLDFETEYPRFHNEYPITSDKVSIDEIVPPTTDKCNIIQGCDRSRICKLPSVVPLSTSLTAGVHGLNLCFTVTIDDPDYYNNFNFDAILPGTKLAALTFRSNVHYKSCNRDSYRDNQLAEMLIVKDNQGWTINPTTETIDEKQDNVGSNLVSLTSQNGLDRKNPLNAGYPDKRCDYCCSNVSYQTAFARCIYGKRTVLSSGKPAVVLYIVGYDGNYPYDENKTIRTGLRFGQWHFRWNWGDWDVWNYSKPVYHSGYVAANIYDRYTNRNNLTSPYLKKLDEIAWYSKGEFPYLTGETDPGAPMAKQWFPWDGEKYPMSFRRVKFRYNYELAPETPNSLNPDAISTTNAMSGGRLTLKEVREEAGPEDASVSMPPYLFEYQVKDQNGVAYNYGGTDGFNNQDAWGMRTDGSVDPDERTAGINWNLKSVLTPLCGKIDFNYERDYINSIFGAFYRMSLKGNHTCPSDELFVQEPTVGDYYKTTKVTNISADGLRFTVQNTTGLIAGQYVFFNLEITKPGPTCVWGPMPDDKDYLAVYWGKISEIVGNVVTIDSPLLTSAGLTVDPTINNVEMKAVKNADAWCGDLRTSSIQYHSFNSDLKTKYDYGTSGDIEVLPQGVLPDVFSRPAANIQEGACKCSYPRDYACSIPGIPGNITRKRIFVKNLFSRDLKYNFNTGNSSVMYPHVETVATDDVTSTSKNWGITGYDFYTVHDVINGKPMIQTVNNKINGTEIPVRRIIDRSGMIGQLKKLSIINSTGETIYESENRYSFGDDLPKPDSAGVFYNSLNGRLPVSKPIGVIEERTKNLGTTDGVNFVTRGLTDYIMVRSYVTGNITNTAGKIAETKIGLFDAMTGQPSVTLSKEYDNTGAAKQRITGSIPLYLLLNDANSQQNAYKQALKAGNVYNLQGETFTGQAADFEIPADISTIIANHNSNTGDFRILNANVKAYFKNDYSAGTVPFSQSMFYMNKGYSWIGGNYTSYYADATNWKFLGSYDALDRFSRVISTTAPSGLVSTYIFHPAINYQIATIAGSNPSECAVFTCDYDDDMLIYERDAAGNIIHIEDGYFDKMNGWEKGAGNYSGTTGAIVKLAEDEKHFGKKCVYVEYAYGPTKNCKIEAGKNYLFSAWVKVTEERLKLVAEYRRGTDIMHLGVPEDFAVKTVEADGSKWQYVELEVPAANLTGDDWYIRMWVGHDLVHVKAFVDDIRFRPDDALVTSVYYDHNLRVPVATVDANNKAAFIRYDNFGRVTESGIIKDNP